MDENPKAITGCVKTLRSNIRRRLMKVIDVARETQDVIVNDDRGYHLNDEKITVRDGTDTGDIDERVERDGTEQ
ncbi:MAG TPA: hypothetical protein ENN09_01670 [Planctomycetes bacterium]|nr:hypothetical protein [Planctomycetota bacterium]